MIHTKTRRRLAVATAVIAEQRRTIARLDQELANARAAVAAVARQAYPVQVAPDPADSVNLEGVGTPLYDAVRADTLGLQAVTA
ncbi:hypothetical protein ACFVJS_04015 [Nocardioides sp. NPDC057772]|uniref:hypothetical protein n=1 Tax=Nocardioides sp. NPDC057772 TaxID=3346245 RepID=UPI00366F7B52